MHTKTGLQYFPFDVDFFMDDKIQLLSAEFQTKGEAIVIRLLCKIYANGYFYYCGEDEIALLARSIGDGTKPAEVKDVIYTAINRRIFHEDIYEGYGILTSAGVQKRYLEATGRRKKVEVIEEYWLLDTTNLPSNFTVKPLQNVYILPPKCIHQTPKMYTSGESVDNILSQNVDTLHTSCVQIDSECTPDVDILKQSKVKERKVKESKVGSSAKSAITPLISTKNDDLPKPDFIDRIISVFQEEFVVSRDFPYAPKVEDRKHAKAIHTKMVEVLKNRDDKKHTTEEILEILRVFFREALKIEDRFHYAKMDITHMNSRFNEIMVIIKKGSGNGKGNVSDSQLYAAAAAALRN